MLSKAGKFKANMARIPYNKLLSNPASLSRTAEYWPLLVLVCARSVLPRPQANILQYGPRARLALATISIDFSFLPFSCVYFHTSIGPAFHIDAVFIQLADFARCEVIVALALEFVFA